MKYKFKLINKMNLILLMIKMKCKTKKIIFKILMSLYKRKHRKKCRVRVEIKNLWNQMNHKKKL
jgi:hypothetical protein